MTAASVLADSSDSELDTTDAAPEDLKGTGIIAGTKTQYFTTMDGYYNGDNQSLRSTTFAGMGIGFAMLGIFFIFVGYHLVMDELARIAYFEKKVKEYKEKLKTKYGNTHENLKILETKFELADLM